MSERDWDRELRKIDEQMERAAREPAPTAGAPPAVPRASAPVGAAGAAGAPPSSSFGVFVRLALATALGVGIIFWPYGARCGFGLAAYLAAVLTVIVSGAWSALWTWRYRWGRAHLLGLLLVVWGSLLAAVDVLPRVGYAIPTVEHPASWSCR
ncbi:MAG: hypothetical protein WD771_11785 [Gemmatimonadaceae bacterium]